MIESINDIEQLLSGRIHMADIRAVNRWVTKAQSNKAYLLHLAASNRGEVSKNALWCMTHLKSGNGEWLESLQNELTDILLTEEDVSKQRILLQLLREQTYRQDNIRTDFLDYCFAHINAKNAPYAIRCSCMYCAFKMSRFYPELLAELEKHLDYMEEDPLSPGLACALRTTRRNIRLCKNGNNEAYTE
ncbi:MAG: hypothetical protein NC038_08285 [Paludibacter sp.]|nr:hypothetical protein [Bacteroidales bacterium]MCM1069697.1 hypothetical protein [Prevotella sp.]MCM1354395.1 hypothetical protein [Bacteroides sp.]MCM1441942.1 hypothetical protein [Muribaculum sp.]MCM1482616.1 hypothetical protein [Paludibacter sp.]